MDMRQFAMNMIDQAIKADPNRFSDPRSQEMINMIKSGNESQGMEYANNLCKTYGDNKDSALQKSAKFFGL